MIMVRFENVGRSKLTWSATMKSLDGDALYRAVERSRALMSSDIDFTSDGDDRGMHGKIIVGGMRNVGTWRVVDDEEVKP